MTGELPLRTGVTVGKFHPPHLGHQHLIDEAATVVDHLTIIVCERPDQAMPGVLRGRWLVEGLPRMLRDRCHVVVTPDDLPEEPEPWAERTLELLGHIPLLTITSEDYGPAWAEAMGSNHIPVDVDRHVMPVSATAIRRDTVGMFWALAPGARAALVRRIVLVGAESTGKTTLAEALAVELGASWVPEYGRDHWAMRDPWAAPISQELLHIATEQSRREDLAARDARVPWLICDTDALVTGVWHERYLRSRSPAIEWLASVRPPDLYVLCDDDIPWTQDGTRESRHERRWMQQRTEELVAASRAPVVRANGPLDGRVTKVLAAINEHCPPPDLQAPPGALALRPRGVQRGRRRPRKLREAPLDVSAPSTINEPQETHR